MSGKRDIWQPALCKGEITDNKVPYKMKYMYFYVTFSVVCKRRCKNKG
jgi:hypothetical protein